MILIIGIRGILPFFIAFWVIIILNLALFSRLEKWQIKKSTEFDQFKTENAKIKNY
jgi:hypothetical protein